jgi:hypothetical protein
MKLMNFKRITILLIFLNQIVLEITAITIIRRGPTQKRMDNPEKLATRRGNNEWTI